MAKRGTLIVFEGLDRSGKSTQCALLVDHLRQQGRTVEHMRFPNRSTPIGQMINSYLSGQNEAEDHVIHLLFSANRWESAAEIERLVEAGTTVVIDRYYYSGCVYSAAKGVPGMDLAWCRHPEVGLPRPDVCIFLSISEDTAAQRGGYGGERYENQEMQRKVRALFKEMKLGNDEQNDEYVDFNEIDAGRSVEEVRAEIRATVEEVMDNVAHGSNACPKVRTW